MIRAVLLDMGGVLLDTGGGNGLPIGRYDWRGREALLRLARGRRRNLGLDDLEALLFGPWRREYARRYEEAREADWSPYLEHLRQATGCALPDLELLAAWFEPFGQSLEPLPGVRETLVRLVGEGYRLALISNVPLPGALYRAVLERIGLAEHFSHLSFSYDTGSRKPSPRMLLAALSVLGTPPERAVMVGDRRPADVAAGRAAGLRTVWVQRNPAPGPAADAEIAALPELPTLLADW